jgi:hypothetical protein
MIEEFHQGREKNDRGEGLKGENETERALLSWRYGKGSEEKSDSFKGAVDDLHGDIIEEEKYLSAERDPKDEERENKLQADSPDNDPEADPLSVARK